KRTNDYVFALAELQAISAKKNVALGAVVTALDSIEAGRWSTKHLVDDCTSRARMGDAEALKTAIAKRQTLEAETARLAARRKAAVDARLDEPTRTEWKALTQQLMEIDARLAALPAPGMVYAAAHGLGLQPNSLGGTPPRPVYFLHRGSE